MRVDNEFWLLNRLDTTETNIEKTFKKEFSDIEYNIIPEKLFRVFGGSRLKHGETGYLVYSYEKFLDFFGLPYTSSSDFAAFWNTNSYEMLPGWFLQGFALDNENRIIAIASDRAENWTYYNLGEYFDFNRD